jgi:hypothetical protein
MVIILAELMSRCDVRYVGDNAHAVIRRISAVPSDGVPLLISERRRTQTPALGDCLSNLGLGRERTEANAPDGGRRFA